MGPGFRAALRAGALYFAIVFAAGFVFGAVRVLAIAPRIGETRAVLLEVPFMLVLAALACGRILSYIKVPSTHDARLAMGAFAFALLILAEVVLAGGARAWLGTIDAPPGAIGLAGQIVFAFLPALHLLSQDAAAKTTRAVSRPNGNADSTPRTLPQCRPEQHDDPHSQDRSDAPPP